MTERISTDRRLSLIIKLAAEVERFLRWHARISSSDVTIWALAMATVQDNSVLPIHMHGRAHRKALTITSQQAAGVVLSNCLDQTRLYLEPIKHEGELFLMLSCPTRDGSTNLPMSYLSAGKMHCSNFWIALCRQVICESTPARIQHTYDGLVPGWTARYTWSFNGTTELWLDLMEHLLVHPARASEPDIA